jgi:hypothetical protein
MNKPNYTIAIALAAFAAGAFASFFTLPLWVVTAINAAKGPGDWLGFAGSLLGNLLTAIVAAGAAGFAWHGVRYQVQISLMSREEERMERELPGLRDAITFLDSFLCYVQKAYGYGEATQERIREYLATEDDFSNAPDRLKLLLPATDVSLRQRILNALQSLFDACEEQKLADRHALAAFVLADPKYSEGIHEGEATWLHQTKANDVERADRLARAKRLDTKRELENVRSLKFALLDRQRMLEHRLRTFRPRIEAYFD